MPEREIPGSSANDCAIPIAEARRIAEPFDRFVGPSDRRALAPSERLAGEHHQPVRDQESRGRRGRAEESPHGTFEDDAENADRDGADDEKPADALVFVVAQLAPRDARDEGADDRTPFRAVEDDQRDRRAEVQDDDERKKRLTRTIDVVPLKKRRNQDRMSEARHGEEFADALQQGQRHRLRERHRSLTTRRTSR